MPALEPEAERLLLLNPWPGNVRELCTVDTYRSRLLKKLNLKNNAELTRFALQSKLVK